MRVLLLLGLFFAISCGKQGNKTVNVYSDDSQLSEEDPIQLGDESRVNLEKSPLEITAKSLSVKKAKPRANSKKYINLVVSRDDNLRELNNIKYGKGTRSISITGKHIVLDKNDFQEILMHINNAKDLSSLSIESETLQIEIPLRLYQTNVSISTKNLLIGKNASINTTAQKFNSRAAPYKDGLNGLKAGTIKIVASNIIGLDLKREPFLIANATNGQDAGHGSNGARGTNALIKKKPNFYKYRYEECFWESEGHGHRVSRIMPYSCHTKTNKKGSRSGNGKDAIVGGKPGSAGETAHIETSFKLEDYLASIKGAKSGKLDIKRVGGAPGKPAKTCERFESSKGKRFNKTSSCKTAKKGSDKNPKQADLKSSIDGKLARINQEWSSIRVIHHLMKHTKDLYLSGYNVEARLEIANAENILNSDKSDFPRKTIFLNNLKVMESKLAARLDYFGNMKSWTPSFSFAVNYKTFQNEVKSALKTLFYTHLLSLDIADVEKKKESIISFQENLLAEALNTSNKLNSYLGTWETLALEVEDLDVAEKEFEIELKILEREIREMAKRNMKVPFMKKAVGIFATASKVIPVGQPTFGLVGMGVETLYNFTESENPIGDILKNGPSLVKDFQKIDYSAAQKELETKLKSISPEHLAKFTKAPTGETGNERVKRIKNEIKKKSELVSEMVSFYKPIYDSVSAQVKKYESQEMSKSALDSEINKIKKSHKVYNRVIKKLKKLLALKTKIRNKLIQANMMFTQGVNRITANYLTISDLYTELSDDVNLNKEILNQTLQRYKTNASERLLYYHYRLSKSFEYKTLRSYKRELNLEHIFNSMIQLIEVGENKLSSNDLDKLMTIYREELSDVFSDLMDYYEKIGESTTLSKSFYLNSSEISALNSGNKIYLNLLAKESFGSEKKNIRIQNLVIIPKYKDGSGISEVRVTHDELSIIEGEGGDYVFTHDDRQKNSYWVASTDLRTHETVQGSIATEDLDIINTVFDIKYPLSKLQVNPSARSYYLIEKLGNANNEITELEVEIEYSYQY